jgi:GMP synthase (glutamine-hydrolysing)
MLCDDRAGARRAGPRFDAKGGEVTHRIILVTHDDGARADRASRYLDERGHGVEWTCPAQGGGLPEPNGAFDAAIVYGGLDSVNDHSEKTYLKAELDWIGCWVGAGKPYLGLCLGGQLLAHSLGGRVAPHGDGLHEYGFFEVRPTAAGREVLPGPLHVYQAHYEGFGLPHGAELLMTGETYANQGFRYGANAYGLQFHPEVTPQLMVRWLDEDRDRMDFPGVHSRDRQIADSRRYNEAMGAWFENFLESWLGGRL